MTLPAGIRVAWREIPAGAVRRDVSRALLRELLPDARFLSRCGACGGDHGRVHVEGADAAVSVSYADGWAVVAVAWGHGSIGVDAVSADAVGIERVLPSEADLRPAGAAASAQARMWARVEAVLKADGRGLAVDPRDVEVTLDGAEWSARVRSSLSGGASAREGGGAEGRDRMWRGWDLHGPDGVVLAVAAGARARRGG
ncbi:4'-phosphopantetheinyl transferase family protein [Microbacterium testaceum]|uniref:4'-phosphopantetheinyl transferase family protein n=1 Tax=Microbacterium testaceum TaxID=2033 RepID=UPI001249475B|nr:4'-phosphopantetheinyl transferase superfamily protein [Microbacterium testaceum]